MTVVATKWVRGGTSTLLLTFVSNRTGNMSSNDCRSIDVKPFKSCYWTNSWKLPLYITESCYNSLTDEQKGYARAGGAGMVKDSGYFVVSRMTPHGPRYKFNPDAIIPYPVADPCEGVVCDPECVGVDRYATVCKEGECVRGALIEKNSPVCGYVKPVCTEGDKRSPETCWNGTIIHKEVCSGNKWVPTGAICPTKPKPECTDGDKKPGYICRGGKWIPHTPEPPVPGEGRLYVKFAIPILDLLPWIPYEPWMWIPPGFEVVEVS